MLLEVIAKDLRDIKIINNSNANRIEFCRELKIGGLTPFLEDIIECCSYSVLPVNVIVRNAERDFFYSDEEKKEMIEQIKAIKNTKANGIVIGALNKDLTIDTDFLKQVIEIKGDLEVTFHKAFDEVKDFKKSYAILNELKINNVLTSGGKNIKDGMETLKELVSMNLDTKVLIGGGVNQDNFLELKQISDNIHVGSCVRNNSSWDELSSAEKINELLEK